MNTCPTGIEGKLDSITWSGDGKDHGGCNQQVPTLASYHRGEDQGGSLHSVMRGSHWPACLPLWYSFGAPVSLFLSRFQQSDPWRTFWGINHILCLSGIQLFPCYFILLENKTSHMMTHTADWGKPMSCSFKKGFKFTINFHKLCRKHCHVRAPLAATKAHESPAVRLEIKSSLSSLLVLSLNKNINLIFDRI